MGSILLEHVALVISPACAGVMIDRKWGNPRDLYSLWY